MEASGVHKEVTIVAGRYCNLGLAMYNALEWPNLIDGAVVEGCYLDRCGDERQAGIWTYEYADSMSMYSLPSGSHTL